MRQNSVYQKIYLRFRLSTLHGATISPDHQQHLIMLVKAGVCHGVHMGELLGGGRNHGVQPWEEGLIRHFNCFGIRLPNKSMMWNNSKE